MTTELDPRWVAALHRAAAAPTDTAAAWARIVAPAGSGSVAPGEPARAAGGVRRLGVAAAVLVAGGALAGGLLAARGDGGGDVVRAGPAPAATTVAPSASPEVGLRGLVVEAEDGDTTLCPDVMSVRAMGGPVHPPACTMAVLVGWDWDQVDGEQREGGTTWGTYDVVGTYDRGTRTFTLTRPPAPEGTIELAVQEGDGDGSDGPRRAPCPEPEGGWGIVDPTRVALADYLAFRALVEGADDFAGMWVDQRTPPGQPDIGREIYVVGFTGDLAGHEAAIREVWGGPLCLVEQEHSRRELDAISAEAVARLEADGAQPLSIDSDDVTNVIRLHLFDLEPGDQARVDERYGPGVVVLTSAMRPLG